MYIDFGNLFEFYSALNCMVIQNGRGDELKLTNCFADNTDDTLQDEDYSVTINQDGFYRVSWFLVPWIKKHFINFYFQIAFSADIMASPDEEGTVVILQDSDGNNLASSTSQLTFLDRNAPKSMKSQIPASFLVLRAKK